MSNGKNQNVLRKLVDRHNQLRGEGDRRTIEEATIYGNQGIRGIPTFSQIDLSEYKKLVPDPVITGDVTDQPRLQEIRARNQHWMGKWGNGLAKFVGKTVTNTLGGLAMLPTTVGVAIGQAGDLLSGQDNVAWRNIYDNAFQKAMDDASSFLDENLPNYRTRAEQDMSLVRQLGTANFWADDFLGGMSFLTGAVLSEMGTVAALSKIGKAVRLGKTLDSAAKADDVLGAYKSVGVRNMFGDAARIGRQVITGAGYEAGVEARHFRDEALRDLTQNFTQTNGREPNIDEVAALTKQANSVANGVFVSNLAAVSLGNMAALSKTFGLGVRSAVTPANPSKFIKQAGRISAKPLTGWDRTQRFVKNAFIKPGGEAAEEFSQGLIQSSAMDYIMGKYSPGGADAQYSIIEALGNAFGETMDSKDTWKETFLGYLLGLVGVPHLSSSSAVDAFNSLTGRADRLESTIADRYNKVDTLPIFSSALRNNNRQYELEKQYDSALEEGDMFRAKNIENMQVHSWLSSRYDAGMLDEDVSAFTSEVDQMNDDEFRSSFGYDENFSSEQIEQRKEKTSSLLKDLSTEYKDARQIAEGVVQNKTDLDLLSGLTHSVFSIKNVDNRVASIEDNLAGTIDGIRPKQLTEALNKMVALRGVQPVSKIIKALKSEEEYAEQARIIGENIKDPLKANELKSVLIDLQRLKLRRDQLVQEYNAIASPKGQKNFSELADNLRNASMKRMVMDAAYRESLIGRRQALENELAEANAEQATTPAAQSAKESKVKRVKNELNKVVDAEGYDYFTDEPVNLSTQTRMAGKEDSTMYDFQSELFRGLGAVGLQFNDVRQEIQTRESSEGIEQSPPPTPPSTAPENLFVEDPDAIAKRYDDLVMVYNTKNLTEQEKIASDEVLRLMHSGEEYSHILRVVDYPTNDPHYKIGKNVFIERGSVWPDGSRKSIEVYTVKDGKETKMGAILAPDRFGYKVNNQFVPFDPNDPKDLAKINPRFATDNRNGEIYRNNWNALKDFWDYVKQSDKPEMTSAELQTMGFKVVPHQFLNPEERPPLSDVYTADEHGFIEIEGRKALVVSYPKGGFWYRHDGGLWKTLNVKHPLYADIQAREDEVMRRRTRLGRSKKKGGEALGREKQNAAVLLIKLGDIDEFVSLQTAKLDEQSVRDIEFAVENADDILREYTDVTNMTHREVWEQVVDRLGVRSFQTQVKGGTGIYGENKPISLTSRNFSLPITMRDADGEQLRFDTEIKVFINKGEKGFGFNIRFTPFKAKDSDARIDVNIRKNTKGVWFASTFYDKKSYSTTIGENFTISELIRSIARPGEGTRLSVNDRFVEAGITMNYTEQALVDPTVVGFDSAPVHSVPRLRMHVYPKYPGKTQGNTSRRKGVLRKEFGDPGTGKTFIPLKKKKVPKKDEGKWIPIKRKKKIQQPTVQDTPVTRTNVRDLLANMGRTPDKPAFAIMPDGAAVPIVHNDNFDDQGDIEIITPEGNVSVNVKSIYGVTDPNGTLVWQREAPTVEQTSQAADSEVSGDKSVLDGLADFDEKLKRTEEGEKRPLKRKEIKDDDIPFSIENTLEGTETYDLNEAVENLKQILPIKDKDNPSGTFEVKDIAQILGSLRNNGVTMGALLNDAIYLLIGGKEYHEAFHGVFRVLVGSAERSKLYKQAERKFGKPTKADIKALRNKSESYRDLSDEIIYNLALEEKLAEDFNGYALGKKKQSAFAKVWNKILKFIRAMLGKQDELEIFYDKILQGQFKEAVPSKDRIYTHEPVFAVLKSVGVVEETDEGVLLGTTRLNIKDSNMLVTRIAKSLMGKGIFSPTLADIQVAMGEQARFFRPDNWYDEVSYVEETRGVAEAQRIIARLTSIYNAMNTDGRDIIYDRLLALTDDPDGGYRFIEREDKGNDAEILRDVKVKLSFYAKPDNFDVEDATEEGEDAQDTTPELFHRGANKYGGFNSESKALRTYLSFITAEHDYFGLGLTEDIINGTPGRYSFPIDAQTVYNGLLNALKNVPKTDGRGRSQLLWTLDALSSHSYNSNIAHFTARLVADIYSELKADGLDLVSPDEVLRLSHDTLTRSNYYNMFVGGFHKIEQDYMQVNFIDPDPENGKYSTGLQVFNAAQSDSSRLQYDRWVVNFRRLGVGRGELLQLAKTDIPALLIPVLNRVRNGYELEQVVTDSTKRLDAILRSNFGIEISPLLIRYSIIKNLDLDPDQPEFAPFIEFIEAFPHIDGYEYLNPEFIDGLFNAVKASKDGNIYQIRNMLQEDIEGAIGRLKRLAYTNTYFDEQTRVNNIQNAEGETIYTITAPSYDTTLALKIRQFARSNPEQIKTFREHLKKKQFDEAYPIFRAIFGGLLRTEYRTRKYFDILKFNPLLKDPSYDLTEFFPKVILGSRTQVEDNAPSSNFRNMGTSFWKLDKATKILTMMSLYADSSATHNTKGERLIIPAILEDKSTTKLYSVPTYNYTDQRGQLTDLGLNHLSSHLQAEYERINKVQNEIRQILAGETKISEVLDDYHLVNNIIKHPDTGTVYRMERVFVDGELVGLEFTETDPADYKVPVGLKLFNFHEMPGAEDIASSAREGKPFTEVQSAALDGLKTFVDTQFQAFMDMISSDASSLVRKEGGNYVNRYLPNSPDFKYVEGKNVKLYAVKQFFVGDYINSMSINAFYHGDISMGLHKSDFAKNARDVVKRNGGILSSGNELGGSVTTVASIVDAPTVLDSDILARNNDGEIRAETQDGQSYASGSWYVDKYLSATSKATPKVREIGIKIKMGLPVTEAEAQLLEDSAAILNDKKISVRSMYDYIKTSAHMQTREKVSYIDPVWKTQYSFEEGTWQDELRGRWQELEKLTGENRKSYFDTMIRPIYKPIRGFEYHHNMLNTMDARGIAIIYTSTASKLSHQDIGNYEDGQFQLVPYEIADNFIREQVKTDKFATEIIHSTQMQQLVWSEQDNVDEDGNPVQVSVEGVPTTPISASESYIDLLAFRVLNGMNVKREEMFDEDGDIDYDRLWAKIKPMLESSNPDPQLIELFRVESGLPVYNWNLPSVYKKLQAMYLSYVSRDTLKHKVPGFKYTLVAGKGHEVVVDKNDRVVPKYEYVKDPNHFNTDAYNTRKLKFEKIREENGVSTYESEVIVSQRILKEYGLKVGDQIPADLLLQSGTRIPTQDKHSMLVMRVVDFLPAYYGTSVVIPEEAVWLAGEDFDIDAKYAFRYTTYKVGDSVKKFGGYLTKSNPYKTAWREYQQSVEEIDYEEFLAEYQNRIDANQGHYKAGEFGKIKPVTVEENNNLLLSLELALIHNKANRNIRSTATSLKPFREADKYFENLGIELEQPVYGVASAYDKATAVHEINVGDAGIGPVALFNVLFQRLNKYNIKLVEGVDEVGEPAGDKVLGQYDSFTDYERNGERINDMISATITAMTDNAKELIAARYNLNANNLGPFLTMVMMGVPFNTALSFMKQPIVSKLTNMVEGTRRLVRTVEEQKDLRKGREDRLKDFIDELFGPYIDISAKSKEDITGDNLAEALQWATDNEFEFGQERELDERGQNFIALQQAVALQFAGLNEMSTELQAFSQIMRLIKGTKSTWEDEADIYERLNTIGVTPVIEKTSYLGDDFEVRKNQEGKYVANYRLGDESYKISFQQQEDTNFALGEIINKDKLIFTQLASRIVLERDSTKVFIQNTEDFKDFIGGLTSMLKPSSLTYANSRAKVNQEVLTFLNLRAYIHMTGYKPDLLDVFDSVLVGEDTVSPIEYLAGGLLDHPFYKNNPLLRFLRFRTRDYKQNSVYIRDSQGEGTLNIVEGNTRTNTDPDYKNMLLDGYSELLFSPVTSKFGESYARLRAAYEAARDQSRATSDDTYLVNFMSSLDGVDKAKLLSSLLYDYLILRDGMQYRNNGIVKNLDPKVFKTFAKSLDAVQALFAGDKSVVFKGQEMDLDYESVFGKSKDRLVGEMMELYGRNIANKGDLRYRSQKFLFGKAGQQKGKRALFIDRFSGELKVSLFAGTADLKTKEARSERIKENKKLLASTGIFTRFADGMILPFTFSTSVYKGDRSVSKVYKLKSLTRDKKEIADPTEFVKGGRIEGSYAVYELVDYFADRQVTPYSFEPNYMEVFPRLMGLSQRKLEGKEKVDYLKGLISSLPGNKGYPLATLTDGKTVKMQRVEGDSFNDTDGNTHPLVTVKSLTLGGEIKYGEQSTEGLKTVVDKTVRPAEGGKWLSIKEMRERAKKDNNLKCD